MKASGAAPDASKWYKPPAKKWKPSGALSNPDSDIEDMPLEEYNQRKGHFFQPCAKIPKMDGTILKFRGGV